MPNPKGNPKTLKSYKPAWKHGQTRTIRVPIVLVDKILEYARKLDEQIEEITKPVTSSNSEIAEAIKIIEEVRNMSSTKRLNKEIKGKLTEAIRVLESMTHVNEANK